VRGPRVRSVGEAVNVHAHVSMVDAHFSRQADQTRGGGSKVFGGSRGVLA
jgi:hypothetical protein